MKHADHICRFNDHPQTCDCYDSGYEKGVADTFARVGDKILNEAGKVNDNWGDPRRLGAHQALTNLYKHLTPPSNRSKKGLI